MPYGQKFYLQPQGIPPTRYRLDQVGCFVTSFCNLLERLGRGAFDPATLNAIFRDNGIYIDVDDGVRDDLGWSSISQIDGNIVVTSTGGGWPPTNEAIVKFHYTSPRTGVEQDHLCLVADTNAHTIIDSYDGQVRNPGYYGEPVAYATYGVQQPTPIVPIAPPPVPQPSRFEDIAQTNLVANKQPVHIWDLNAQNWPDFKAVQDINQGEPFTATAIYHHPLGGNYYTRANGDMNGINVVDLSPAPVIEVTPPPQPPLVVNDTNTIPVTVINTDWKGTFVSLPQEYVANSTIVVKDLAGLRQDIQLVEGQRVLGAGVFEKDGVGYVRTNKSVLNDMWYGIPKRYLDIESVVKDDDDAETVTPDLKLEAEEFFKNFNTRDKIIRIVGTTQGFLLRVLNVLNIFNKQGKK